MVTFSSDEIEIFRKIERHHNNNFVELVQIAGLNPKRDFRHLNLTNVDFRNCNLSGFNFSGSDLHRAKFKNSSIKGTTFDKGQMMLPELVSATDYSIRFANEANPLRKLRFKEKQAAYYEACVRGDISLLRNCFQVGVRVNQSFSLGGDKVNALLVAMRHFHTGMFENVDIFDFLLRAGIKVNFLSEHGDSALAASVWAGDLNLVKLFLSYGAKPDLNGDNVYNPMDQAIHNENYDIASILYMAGAKLPLTKAGDIIVADLSDSAKANKLKYQKFSVVLKRLQKFAN